MQKLKKTIEIKAEKEKVWNVLWDDKTYREWTSAFAPGSYAETDWQQGSKVLFLDGQGNGMVSKIVEAKKPETMKIEHLGMVKEGKENFDDPEIKEWAGAREDYSLSDANGITTLVMEQDIDEKHKNDFEEMWDKALANVKRLSETN